jgi:hypothetical protein
MFNASNVTDSSRSSDAVLRAYAVVDLTNCPLELRFLERVAADRLREREVLFLRGLLFRLPASLLACFFVLAI